MSGSHIEKNEIKNLNISHKKDMMNLKLRTILNKTRLDEANRITHISMVIPRGKYGINADIYEEFYTAYCDSLYYQPECPLGLADKNSGVMLPVLVDKDLSVLLEKDEIPDKNKRLYTMDQVKEVISIYQRILGTSLEKKDERTLMCVLLEKSPYICEKNGKRYFKNGFHLHFPFLFLNKNIQKLWLVPRIDEELKTSPIFDSWKDRTIDGMYVVSPWLLYGSRKDPALDPYLISKCFNGQGDEITMDELFSHATLKNQKNEDIPFKQNIRYYLPMLLTTIQFHNTYDNKLHPSLLANAPPTTAPQSSSSKEEAEDKSDVEIAKELQMAKELLDIMDTSRAEVYSKWLEIGWILYNITRGTQSGLDLWIYFSKKCEEKFEENACISSWNSMKMGNYSISSLHYYARLDNPTEYKALTTVFASEFIDSSISLKSNHYDMAMILYYEYRDKFVCINIKNNIWFEYKNHKWNYDECGSSLRNKIPVDLVSKYAAKRAYYTQLLDGGTSDMAKYHSSKIEQINKIVGCLKTTTFIDNIMKECRYIFSKPEFYNKMDQNTHLIGFKNGVYDLSKDIFRDGKPDDLISKAMPIDYQEYDERDGDVQDLEEFFEKVFPDETMRKYFIDVSCDVFVGGNYRKIVCIWVGKGNNGKSATSKLFENMLGEYWCDVNPSLITAKRNSSNSAAPELARLGGGVRWVTIKETSGQETINEGVFRELSGNDSYFARDLFAKGKETKEITPLFKMVFQCNIPPKIPAGHPATWQRIRVILFEAVFVNREEAPLSYEEQLEKKLFPKDIAWDPSRNDKVLKLAPVLAWYLINYRKNRGGDTNYIPDPAKVLMATQKYQCRSDFYSQFRDEILVEDNKGTITVTELYNAFKVWFKESLPGQNIPIKNDVKDSMSDRIGNIINNKWTGWRIKTINDEIERGEAIVITKKDVKASDML